MEIEVNGENICLFSGARVEHAIRRYSEKDYRRVRNGRMMVRDRYGNEVKLGGELTGREKLLLVFSEAS